MTSANKYPGVLIILLNYKKYSDTLVCLKSLKKVAYPNFEVIVIDNNSENESAGIIRKSFPEVNLIESEQNLGFAGGNNIGIRYGLDRDFDFVLLLNNDTTVHPDFLDHLMETMQSDEKIGIAGSTILYPDSNKIWCQGGSINWLNASARFWNVKKEISRNPIKGSSFYAGFIIGACMLIRKSVFGKIGFLREDYFMYLEDLDFCWQARKDFRFAVNPRSIIHHHIGSSTGGIDSYLSTYYVFRNKLYFIMNNYNMPMKAMALCYYFLYSLFRRYPVWFLKGKFDLMKAHIIGVRDFFWGIKGAKIM